MYFLYFGTDVRGKISWKSSPCTIISCLSCTINYMATDDDTSSQGQDKTVSRPSYYLHGDPYTGKTASLYWDRPRLSVATVLTQFFAEYSGFGTWMGKHYWFNSYHMNNDLVWRLTHAINIIPLHRRHNECDGDSNHRRYDCLLSRLFRRRSMKTWKLRVTGLCEGNSLVTREFSAQRASNAENPFDDVIMRQNCLYTIHYH